MRTTLLTITRARPRRRLLRAAVGGTAAVLAAGLAVAVVGCKQPPPGDVTTSTTSTTSASKTGALADQGWVSPFDWGDGSPKRPSPPPLRTSATDGDCETLTEAEAPDVLRVMGFPASNGLVLYANSQAGLAIVDVSDREDPKVLRTSEFTGTPIGVFELTSGVATVVFSPWDRAEPETVIRAVDISRVGRESKRTLGRTLGEIKLRGAARDAVRIGEILVVTRDLPKSESMPTSAPSLPMTAVTTFTFSGGTGGTSSAGAENGFIKRDEIRIPGHGSVMGASPSGVAIARETPIELGFGPEKSSITWIGIAQRDFGIQRLHGMTTISGVIPRWRRAADHVVDVTEDSFVRVIACATAACPGGGQDAAAYAGIDFAEPDHPRVVTWSLLARAGDAAFNFDGDRLFVARPPESFSSQGLNREATTELTVFRTSAKRDLESLGSVKLKGTVSSLAVRPYRVTDDVVALGWTGSAASGKRAIIHHIDSGRNRAPRLVGSTSFGGDWTWSPAYDDDRAMSFDPTSNLAAIPMTTMRGQKGGAFVAAQVLSLEPLGPPRLVLEREVSVADRLLFVDGRLLAFSSDGVAVVRHPNEHELNRMKRFISDEDVRSIIR